MMGFFSEIFCWWGGNTWGTRLTIWRQGRLVGKDEFGNRYYEQKKGVGPLGRPRRWVTYRDVAEASKVPAGWRNRLFTTPKSLSSRWAWIRCARHRWATRG